MIEAITMPKLVAPFPWFGGKSMVADVLWRAFGDVCTFTEPFAGSLAALLGRPTAPRIETVNDLDGFIANFWRAIAGAPDEVAEHADWPVNEADLHARHAWLVRQRESLTDRLMGDPEYFDAQIAGWWVWGISCWIGSGWCRGSGPWTQVDGKLVRTDESDGVRRKLPLIHNGGVGVHQSIERKLPAIHGRGSKGVQRQLPHVTEYAAGTGVHQTLEVRNDRGVGGRFESIRAWMRSLAQRLRRVRVCCGDWTRVMGPSVVLGTSESGVFFDPPYIVSGDLYSHDAQGVAEAVHAWAVEHGSNPKLRIAVCGYEGDFDWPSEWRAYAWKARGGYGSQDNAARERIWFSPACLDFQKQLGLFGGDR